MDLQVGDRWTYDWTYSLVDSSGDTLNYTFQDSVEVYVVSIDDSVLGMTGLACLGSEYTIEGWPEGSSSRITERVWYRISPDEVVEVAYQGTAGLFVLPKGHVNNPIRPRPSLFNPLPMLAPVSNVDSAIKREEDRVALKYPLSQGLRWRSFSYPFEVDREVEEIEVITTPSGTHLAARIRSLYVSIAPELLLHDWVTSRGLVQRRIRMSVILTTADGPEGGETASLKEDLVLTNYSRGIP